MPSHPRDGGRNGSRETPPPRKTDGKPSQPRKPAGEPREKVALRPGDITESRDPFFGPQAYKEATRDKPGTTVPVEDTIKTLYCDMCGMGWGVAKHQRAAKCPNCDVFLAPGRRV
jgi:hypothetical protein